MEEFETEYKLAELINKAIKFRDEFDLDNFNKTIEEIDAIEFNRKFEFIELLFDQEFTWMLDPDFPDYKPLGKEIPKDFEEAYKNLEWDWHDKFILNDIEYSYDTMKSLELLETLMMIGKSCDNSFYQQIITGILQKIDIETDEIYYAREYLLNSYILSDYIPDCFKLKENEVLPKLEPLTEGTPLFSFIFNKEGVVEFEIDPFYDFISEGEIQLGREYRQARIEENLKLIPVNDTLKRDFMNLTSYF